MNSSLIDNKQKRSMGKKSNIKGGKVGMKNITIFILTILLVPFLNVAISFAASDAEIQKLKQMIMENKKQNEILMQKVEQLEAEKASKDQRIEKFISEQEQKDLEMAGLMKFFDAIDLGFYIDTTYQYAFDHPNGEDIPLRSLYPEDNEFEIDAFTISISKTPTNNTVSCCHPKSASTINVNLSKNVNVPTAVINSLQPLLDAVSPISFSTDTNSLPKYPVTPIHRSVIAPPEWLKAI